MKGESTAEVLDDQAREAIGKIVSEALPEGDPSHRGHEGLRRSRAESLTAFLEHLVRTYAPAFRATGAELLEACEKRRNYWALNCYQEANFPALDRVTIFETREELRRRFPSGKFRCPRCDGVSTHPQVCNSGKEMEPGQVCDWKSFGLFGTLGKGYSCAARDAFLEHGTLISHTFAPIELESEEGEERNAENLGVCSTEPGRVASRVRCACGHHWRVYHWSAAGHGVVRCPKCRQRWGWPSLRPTPARARGKG